MAITANLRWQARCLDRKLVVRRAEHRNHVAQPRFIFIDQGTLHLPLRRVAERIERCTARSEEHTSELQSLMRISYAVFCLKKKNNKQSLTTPQLFKHINT